MITTRKEHLARLKMFKDLVSKIYKMFNVIERHDEITIYGYRYHFRVLDIYDNGDADVIAINPRDPTVFEGRTRTSLMYARLYKKFFKNPATYRDSKHDNGWRFMGGAMININDGSFGKKNMEEGFRLKVIPKSKRKQIASQ